MYIYVCVYICLAMLINIAKSFFFILYVSLIPDPDTI